MLPRWYTSDGCVQNGENPDLDVYIGADGNLAVYIFCPLCTFFVGCVHPKSNVYTGIPLCTEKPNVYK